MCSESGVFCILIHLYHVEIKYFIQVMLKLLFYRSTAQLENFNNLILMYSGKRLAYSPPVYRARNQLAALDYNANVDREVKRKLDGTVQSILI